MGIFDAGYAQAIIEAVGEIGARVRRWSGIGAMSICHFRQCLAFNLSL